MNARKKGGKRDSIWMLYPCVVGGGENEGSCCLRKWISFIGSLRTTRLVGISSLASCLILPQFRLTLRLL